MAFKRNIQKITILLLLCALPFTALFASSESYIQTLQGKIKKGDSLTVIDDKFLNMPISEWNNLHNLSVNDIISFELRQDTSFYYQNKPFTCTLNITIKYFTSRDQQTPDQKENINLAVKNDTARGSSFPLISEYKFKNAFKVVVIVNSIISEEWKDKLPDIFRLKAQILVERKYPFNPKMKNRIHLGNIKYLMQDSSFFAGNDKLVVGQLPILTPLEVINGQLPLAWDPADYGESNGNNEQYDLEWTWIDAYSARAYDIENLYGGPSGPFTIPEATMEAWMNHDNTRVTLTTNSYTINLPYQKGYVLVRFRSEYFNVDNNVWLPGQWAYLGTDGYSTAVAADEASHDLNWQYTGTFAEEGKRKEVMSYYDATLRSRQLVTINNSDITDKDDGTCSPTAIVQETIYDMMGRPAMNFLPTPVKSFSLSFYPGFNTPGSGGYSFNDIHTNGDDPNGCTIRANPASTASGASRYYSSQNDFIDNHNHQRYYFNDYIPDAGHVPFTLTQYTPDNTGRVKIQSGVGPIFQIGNHDTKYFYGKPSQKELDRLFGMEVGNASHYLKNMVVDPNGQISVSYVDANGKTIATALAGNAPGNLDPLASSTTASTTLNQTLINPNDFNTSGANLNMNATATLLAAVAGTYTLHYSVSPLSLVNTYGNGGENKICSNCYYSVTIKVKDGCGATIGQVTSDAFQGNDITCYDNPAQFTGDLALDISNIGEYAVEYSLQLSNDVINFQTDHYVATNTDLYALDYFFLQQLNSLDLKGCYNTCATCKLLGSQTSFTQQINDLLNDPKFAGIDKNSTAIQNWISQTYTTLSANCTSRSCDISPCEEKLDIMRSDVRPGGQYALYTQNSDGSITFPDPDINVLTYHNSPNTDNNADINTIQNLTITNPDGSTTKISQLSDADFIAAYLQHPEWAVQFVKMHVEYCSYLFCIAGTDSISYQFDQRLADNYDAGSDAVTDGYYDHSNPLATLARDPFFVTGAKGHPYYGYMQQDLLQTSNTVGIKIPNGSGGFLAAKNIVELVDWVLYCKPSASTSSAVVSSWQSCSPSTACRSVTQEWMMYRNYYNQLKSKYIQLAKQAFNPDCRNCFIGTDGLSGSLSNCSDQSSGSSGEEIVCASPSEFYTEQRDVHEETSPRYFNSSNLYIVHTGGPVSTDVQFNVTMSVEQGHTGQFIYTQTLFTMYAGQQEVYAGNNLLSYVNDGSYSVYQNVQFNWTGDLTCPNSGQLPTIPSSSCMSDPDHELYQNKTRIWNDYINSGTFNDCVISGSTVPSQQQSQQLGILNQNAIDNLEAGKSEWMNTLRAVVQDEDDQDRQNGITPRFLSWEDIPVDGGAPTPNPKLIDLVGKLAAVSRANIDYFHSAASSDIVAGNTTQYQADVANLHWASSLPSGLTSTDGYGDFATVFNTVIGSALVQKGFGPDLLTAPYPYNQQRVPAQLATTQVTGDICTNLSAMLSRYSSSGSSGSFYDFLKNQLGDQFEMTSEELTDLQAKCSNGCGYLNNPVQLPLVFSSSNSSTGCSVINTFISDFGTMYPDVAVDSKLYRVLLVNFLNQKLGYSLSVDDYLDFANTQCSSNSSAYLYNQAQVSDLPVDNFSCTSSLVNYAIQSAGQLYDGYIAQVRLDFRNRYISKCLSNAAAVNVAANIYEYHYTLYYYDQSGNLVRTIPPEGVSLLNDDQVNQVEMARTNLTASCSGLSGTFLTNPTAIFNGISSGLDGNSAKALELWLYDPSSNDFQFRVVTPDNKYMLQGAVANSKLWVEVYSFTPGNNGEIVLDYTNKAVADLSGVQVLQSWSHLVAESETGLGSGALQLYLDGNKLTMLGEQGQPAFPVGFEIDGGFTMPSSVTAYFKHLRVYDETLTDAQVLAEYQNLCMNPIPEIASQGSPLELWGRFNIPNAGDPTTTGPGSTNEVATLFVVPNHGLMTFYNYTSLNQVVNQTTPDAGLSRFWYDRLGRLVMSQNAVQKGFGHGKFSYTVYDDLGRITEVGEKTLASNQFWLPSEPDGENMNFFSGMQSLYAMGTNAQVTLTAYDKAPDWAPSTVDFKNATLRKRVAAVAIIDHGNDPGINRSAATFYNYDIEGNVEELTQENAAQANTEKTIFANSDGLKRIFYDYDLISGKVNKVSYQPGRWDQFYYKYEYDADNRIINAQTSRDDLTYKTEARYRYYLHGPLARMELDPANRLQGLDYAYTLQGWLKGVNGQALTGTDGVQHDMSGDGIAGSNYFSLFARDAVAFSLGYYGEDYTSITNSPGTSFYATPYQSPNPPTTGTGNELFNGNISNATYAISHIESNNTVGYTYRYDQLNRLIAMDKHNGLTPGNNWDNASIVDDYAERIAYDANGNIQTYMRNGPNTGGSSSMDNLSYSYSQDGSGRKINNRLQQVNNNGGVYGIYSYDAIGNLINDQQNAYSWTVYGKMATVQKTGTNISYGYDPVGNRITKTVNDVNTYYVRDAQGNVMGVYGNGSSGYSWQEQHLYGSSRLGILNPGLLFPSGSTGVSNDFAYSETTDPVNQSGNRSYELTNHLGNVLATISDQKIAVVSSSNNSITDHFEADVRSAQDYYPFGMVMNGRKYSIGNNYRFGFNGKENNHEVDEHGYQLDYGMRVYDSKLGRFLSVDPISTAYPWNSAYCYAENEPISNIDLDGLEKSKSNNVFSLVGTGINQGRVETKSYWSSLFSRKTFGEIKSTAKDIFGTCVMGDPNAIKRFNFRMISFSTGISNSIQNYTTHPIMWTMSMPSRSMDQNLVGIGYGIWKAGELYVMTELPEIIEGGEGTVVRQGHQVDLMGGETSSLGRKWTNFDKVAKQGIKDDVVNFEKHFTKNSVDQIIVNNPQAEFLQYVVNSLQDNGTIIVRGTLSNKFFKSIYNGKARGMENFDIYEMNPNVENKGYQRTDGSAIKGEIHQLLLKKKSR